MKATIPSLTDTKAVLNQLPLAIPAATIAWVQVGGVTLPKIAQ